MSHFTIAALSAMYVTLAAGLAHMGDPTALPHLLAFHLVLAGVGGWRWFLRR